MRIVETYSNEHDTALIEVAGARHLGAELLLILFSDGKEIKVDFKPFLSGSSHPEIRKYLDENEFRRFRVVDGNLRWGDFDLIFPVADLYEGHIE